MSLEGEEIPPETPELLSVASLFYSYCQKKQVALTNVTFVMSQGEHTVYLTNAFRRVALIALITTDY